MKIGILADIHEATKELRWAIETLRKNGADRLIFVGDLCGMHTALEGTIELMAEPKSKAFGAITTSDSVCRNSKKRTGAVMATGSWITWVSFDLA